MKINAENSEALVDFLASVYDLQTSNFGWGFQFPLTLTYEGQQVGQVIWTGDIPEVEFHNTEGQVDDSCQSS